MTPSELLEESSEFLEAAADAIEKYGHFRGSFGSVESGMCALGAINFAATGKSKSGACWNYTQHPAAARAALRVELELDSANTGIDIDVWSDNAPTQEVIDTLRKLAKSERMEQEGLTP